LFFVIAILIVQVGVAQKSYPTNYFRNPLAIPIQLAANFGEIRNNHYHMGLDIRTQGRENLSVFATADGYISRISCGRGGYGRAIYIKHPNGYTTVYGHLNSFYELLEQHLRNLQYQQKSWQQDITLPPFLFPVEKGDFIGLSGNTGGSGGPHLHFEIRDTKSEENINPRFFGFDIPDNISPTIFGLFWYDRNKSTYEAAAKSIALKKIGVSSYTSSVNTVIINTDKISFGIKAEDKSSNSPFYYGIYNAIIKVDDKLINGFQLDRFSYTEARAINGCIDYVQWANGKGGVQHLSKLPGEELPIYLNNHSGVISLADGLVHTIEIAVKDFSGNEATVIINVQYVPTLETNNASNSIGTTQLIPNKFNFVNGNYIKVDFPINALYDTVNFKLFEPLNTNLPISFQLHNYTVPIHNYYTVLIPLPKGSILTDKYLLTLKSNKYFDCKKPLIDKGNATATFNRFGEISLVIDNKAPVIKPLKFSDNAVIKSISALQFSITDNYKEIANYVAYIDDKWALLENVTDSYKIFMGENISAGMHVIKIQATDVAGNTTTESFNFTLNALKK